MDDAEQPDDPFTLFNLGQVYLDLERPEQALPLLKRSLERSATGDSIVRKLYALIAVCQRRLHDSKEALAVCQEGRWHYPEDVELLFQEAMARRELGDLAGAEAAYQRCLQARQGNHFASIDTGLRGYKARHNLAVLYRDQGRLAEAEAQWRAAIGEQAGFAPSWSCLAELYLAQGRWPELEGAARYLENGLPLASARNGEGIEDRDVLPVEIQAVRKSEQTPKTPTPAGEFGGFGSTPSPATTGAVFHNHRCPSILKHCRDDRRRGACDLLRLRRHLAAAIDGHWPCIRSGNRATPLLPTRHAIRLGH